MPDCCDLLRTSFYLLDGSPGHLCYQVECMGSEVSLLDAESTARSKSGADFTSTMRLTYCSGIVSTSAGNFIDRRCTLVPARIKGCERRSFMGCLLSQHASCQKAVREARAGSVYQFAPQCKQAFSTFFRIGSNMCSKRCARSCRPAPEDEGKAELNRQAGFSQRQSCTVCVQPS